MKNIIKISLLFFLMGLLSTHIAYKYYSPKQSPVDRLISMADGFLISRGLYVVAELNIADQLINGPKTAEQISKNLNINSEATFRLLRMLSAHGIFKFESDSTFALNEISSLLTTKHPQSLHGFLLHEDEARWQAYGALSYTLKTGKPSFNHLFNEGYFDYIARDKKRSEQFDKGMANISEEENKSIANNIDFSKYSHIVDVGGGVGGLLAAILNKYPSHSATLYELPHLASLAENYLKEKNLSDKVQVATGSFLDSVVSGGNLYILKRIMHDWNDETCIMILKNCYSAMDNNAHLIIFDCIIPDGNSYDISKDIDIIMMTIFGGKERTKKDFEMLLNSSGFKLLDIKNVPGTMLSCIKAIKS